MKPLGTTFSVGGVPRGHVVVPSRELDSFSTLYFLYASYTGTVEAASKVRSQTEPSRLEIGPIILPKREDLATLIFKPISKRDGSV